jgi:RNA polymerase sigma-70 factor (ECF subfamily)
MSGDSIPQREFPVTHWTMIGQAAVCSQAAGCKALETVLIRYAPCMKAHLVYMKRMPPDRADDLVQSFIAEKILQGELLKKADRGRGKFRTFLMTSLDRYVISQIRKEQAACRSPEEGSIVNLDDVAEVIEAPASSSSAFDLAWVQEVLDSVITNVREELIRTNRESYWRMFELRVVNPILTGESAPSYDAVVKELGFRSPLQASNALLTAKRMFQRHFREVIAEYADDAEQINEEIIALRAILAGATA